MRRFWAICLIMLTGCGDPESSRLSVGSRAIVIKHERLSPGTHITVVSDEADPDRDRKGREVQVHFDDGEYSGSAGGVVRSCLRPQ